MKNRIVWAMGILAFIAAILGFTIPASATETSANPCNLQGWYVNPDETADKPVFDKGGMIFDGKDLIHHATAPMDFPDVKPYTGSFVATVPGKVVFKMETENPYSTIVQQADGKFWSTAMTYDQEGGQGHPVANVSDLLGKPVKPGKVPFGNTSHVVTFGVGYWVEEGRTVVTSITFHGTTYKLTCIQSHPHPTATTTKPATTPPTTTPTTAPTTTPPTTRPTTAPTTPPTTAPTSAAPTESTSPPVIGFNDAGTDLPLTGPPTSLIFIGGGFLVLLGVSILFLLTRRRRTSFSA